MSLLRDGFPDVAYAYYLATLRMISETNVRQMFEQGIRISIDNQFESETAGYDFVARSHIYITPDGAKVHVPMQFYKGETC